MIVRYNASPTIPGAMTRIKLRCIEVLGMLRSEGGARGERTDSSCGRWQPEERGIGKIANFDECLSSGWTREAWYVPLFDVTSKDAESGIERGSIRLQSARFYSRCQSVRSLYVPYQVLCQNEQSQSLVLRGLTVNPAFWTASRKPACRGVREDSFTESESTRRWRLEKKIAGGTRVSRLDWDGYVGFSVLACKARVSQSTQMPWANSIRSEGHKKSRSPFAGSTKPILTQSTSPGSKLGHRHSRPASPWLLSHGYSHHPFLISEIAYSSHKQGRWALSLTCALTTRSSSRLRPPLQTFKAPEVVSSPSDSALSGPSPRSIEPSLSKTTVIRMIFTRFEPSSSNDPQLSGWVPYETLHPTGVTTLWESNMVTPSGAGGYPTVAIRQPVSFPIPWGSPISPNCYYGNTPLTLKSVYVRYLPHKAINTVL